RATGPWLALGVLLAAVLRTALPHGLFAGVPSWAGVPLMALLGIPFYVCGGGAVPLMHSWLELGISVGAVVAFTVTGAATKVTNLSALLSVMSLRHALLYTLFITLAAMLCGAAVQGCLFFLR
ncbi:MAG: permease, partial [Akkermansia sp.]